MVLEEQEDVALVNNSEDESLRDFELESMDGEWGAEEEPNDWDDLPSVDGDLESDDDGDLVSRSDDEEFPYRLCEGTLDPLES
jgi:hypothetical protein